MAKLPVLAFVSAAAVACSSSSVFSPPYNPTLPTSWAAAVTNTYFPLTPGKKWEYKEQVASGGENITIEVLADKKTVNGVAATQVRDRVFVNGVLLEDTFDWFAQDADGNVWYVGEDTKEYKNGVVVSTEGSWQWGVNGALPGIQMWANPSSKIGEEYRQEYLKGEAEDWAKVLSIGDGVTVQGGTFANCVTTEEWTGLDPGETHETKTYCPGTGLVRERSVGKTTGGTELISQTATILR